MSRDGTRKRRLTRNGALNEYPSFSPDGRWIAFMSERDGSEDVFVMRPDGTGARNLTQTPSSRSRTPAWAPDGRVTFTRHGETGPTELWVANADGSGAARLDAVAEPVFAFDWLE